MLFPFRFRGWTRRTRPWLAALWIVLGYLVAGSLWVVLSDRIVAALDPLPAQQTMLQTAKGVGFVLFTSLFLLALLARAFANWWQAETEARSSAAQMRLALDAAQAGVWTGDPATGELTVSPGARAVLGWATGAGPETYDEYLGRVDPRDRPAVEQVIARAVEHLAPFKVEHRIRRDDGSQQWVVLRGRPLGSHTAAGIRLTGILQDITDRKQAEELARRHAARTEALLRTAAHLNAQLDLDAVVDAVCRSAAEALQVPAARVLLHDVPAGVLRHAGDCGLPPAFRAGTRPLAVDVFQELVPAGTAAVVPDLQALRHLPDAALYAQYDLRTLATAPMWREGNLVGALNLLTIGRTQSFTHEELMLLQGFADQAAQAIANAQLYEQAQRRLRHVQSLREIDRAVMSSLDLRVTLDAALEQIPAQLGVAGVAVLMPEGERMVLQFVAGRGLVPTAAREPVILGEGITGRAAQAGHTVRLPDVSLRAARSIRLWQLSREGVMAYFAVPLITKGRLRGVLELFHRRPLHPDGEWLDYLQTLAGQTALAIDNTALFDSLQRSSERLSQSYDETIAGWSRALDLRDRETEGHSQRVTEGAVRLGQALGLTAEALIHLRRGALLHDIGKMGIPDSILQKPGPLNEAEWAVMRRHPDIAYDLLSSIAFLRPALDIPHYHHERWDGTGYPAGLRGDEIPLSARVFAVIDVWDALRSDRPYRPAWSEERVREHIAASRGTHFDPRVVDAFLDLLPR